MRLISKSEFAKERGVSAGRVSHWLRDGRVVEIDGKIDADQAHAALDAALDRTKGMRRAGNITSSAGGAAAAAPIASSAPPSGESGVYTSGQLAADQVTADLPLVAVPGDTASVAGARGAGDVESEAGAGSAAAGKEGTRDTSGYWEHKAKREKFEAELAEMKYLQAAGALVSAPGVRKERMETARSVRNALLAIPDRISMVLDPANPTRAHKLLTGEIQKVLRELSVELEERANVAVGPDGPGAPAAPGDPGSALQ